MTLVDQIKKQEQLSSKLEPSKEDRNTHLSKVHTLASNFIENIEEMGGYSTKRPDGDFSVGNIKGMDELLNFYQSQVIEPGIRPATGGHVGYIPGGGIYHAALGDYLADISNEYAGMYFGSPGAVSIENAIIDWTKTCFDFPESAVGNITSGGSIANLIALTAARDKHQIKGSKIEKSVIYCSAHIHHCINKAIRIIGLEDVVYRELTPDENFKIDPKDLQSQIDSDKKKGLNPFLIIGSAGTTDTGAIDPLNDLAEIAEKEKCWFHVDGAYGGYFYLLEELKNKFDGIQRADSLVVDPHKGLFLPYGTGIVLVKDVEAIMHSHHYTANYMQDAIDPNLPVNPADVSPELTKHFRGLRLWLPLQLLGIEPFKACLREKILLTKYFRERLAEIGFKVGPEPDLSVSYFWYPKSENEEAFNRELMKRIHEDGDVFLSSSVIDGRFVIRMAILSFRTKLSTIDRAVEMIKRCLIQVESGE